MFGYFESAFDRAVQNLLGSGFDEFFSDSEATTYKKKSVTTEDGHVVTSIFKQSPTTGNSMDFYIDDQLVDNPPEWAKKALSTSVAQDWKPRLFEPKGCNNKLPSSVVQGTSAPPMNMYHMEDGSLKLEFALAGIETNAVEISAEDDCLIVNVLPETVCLSETKNSKAICLQRGIKQNDKKLWKKVFIDPNKYDIRKTTWDQFQGLWTIKIPKIQKAENKITFKKAKD